jgi:hypothetical protein
MSGRQNPGKSGFFEEFIHIRKIKTAGSIPACPQKKRKKMNAYETVNEELAALSEMTETEATEFYRTDSKSECCRIIIDYWWYMTPEDEDYKDYIKRMRKTADF